MLGDRKPFMFVEEIETRKAIFLTPLRHGMVLRRCLLHTVFVKSVRALETCFTELNLGDGATSHVVVSDIVADRA